MQLTSDTIKLTPLAASDWKLFFSMVSNPLIMRYIKEPLSEEEAKADFIKKSQPWHGDKGDWLLFTISTLENNAKIGFIGLQLINQEKNIAEVGFMLNQTAQGKGYGYQALKLICQFAFTHLKIQKVSAYCAIENEASWGLLQKSGFVRKATLKNNVIILGQQYDDYLYELGSPFTTNPLTHSQS